MVNALKAQIYFMTFHLSDDMEVWWSVDDGNILGLDDKPIKRRPIKYKL